MTTAVANIGARFRTAPMLGEFQGVDRKAEVIRGVAILQLGEIAGQDSRKLYVDQKTLSQFAQMFGDGQGLKARFTHPDMSSDGLGTFVGRWKSPRIDGETGRADFHLSPRSHDSPKLGDVGKYILDLAESDPDMFGASMVTKMDEAAMKRERRSDGFQPIRLLQLFAIDIVDTPALTHGGLFSADVDLPAEVSGLLDNHFAGVPEADLRERAGAYLNRYLANRYGVSNSGSDDDMNTTATTPATESIDIDAAINKALGAAAEKFGALIDERISKAVADLKPQEIKPSDVEVERKRCSELFATAKNAGLEGYEKIAQEAIDKNLSLEAFKASITDRLIAQNGLTGDTGEQPGDANAKFKAEYAAQRAAFTQMGMTEAEYITSRQVDTGAALLVAGAGKSDAE